MFSPRIPHCKIVSLFAGVPGEPLLVSIMGVFSCKLIGFRISDNSAVARHRDKFNMEIL